MPHAPWEGCRGPRRLTICPSQVAGSVWTQVAGLGPAAPVLMQPPLPSLHTLSLVELQMAGREQDGEFSPSPSPQAELSGLDKSRWFYQDHRSQTKNGSECSNATRSDYLCDRNLQAQFPSLRSTILIHVPFDMQTDTKPQLSTRKKNNVTLQIMFYRVRNCMFALCHLEVAPYSLGSK